MRDATGAASGSVEPSDGTPDPTRVFQLLGDETRLAIVRALATAEGPVEFSALRDRVGAADSGRFNYHLGRLRETLVAKTTDGYVLTATGERVTRGLPVAPDA